MLDSWTDFYCSILYVFLSTQAEIVSFEEGKCLFKMNLGEEHVNKIGTLHGGLTATLIDTFTTFVLVTQPPHVPGVSVDLSIR